MLPDEQTSPEQIEAFRRMAPEREIMEKMMKQRKAGSPQCRLQRGRGWGWGLNGMALR
jgi:hypothetical protein